MGRIILCQPRQAVIPYRFTNTKVEVYSYEELCFYIYNNVALLNPEQLLYHFAEKYTGKVTLIESDSIRSDAYSQDAPESRFERLNQMLIHQEMRDAEALTASMEEYMKYSHVFEEVMRIL